MLTQSNSSKKMLNVQFFYESFVFSTVGKLKFFYIVQISFINTILVYNNNNKKDPTSIKQSIIFLNHL